MPVSVTMPRLGESVTEGTVTRWLKQEGDRVEADEPLLEVSTDKVDTEIPSPAAGVLTKIVVQEDETAEVGSELAVIAGDGEAGGTSSAAAESANAASAGGTAVGGSAVGGGGVGGSAVGGGGVGGSAVGGGAAGAGDADGGTVGAGVAGGGSTAGGGAGTGGTQSVQTAPPAQPAPAPTPSAGATQAPQPAAGTATPTTDALSASVGGGAPADSAPSPSSGGTTVVTMPALGESVTEGTVTRWLKQVGEQVEADEALLEVSTDKVDTEIPSPAGGTLLEIKVPEDETAAVGAELAVIGTTTTAPTAAPSTSAPSTGAASVGAPSTGAASVGAPSTGAAPTSAPSTGAASADNGAGPATSAQAPGAGPTGAPTRGDDRQPEPQGPPQPQGQAAGVDGAAGYVTPLVRKLASEHGVELSSLRGTGVGGRIRKQDVIEAADRLRAARAAAAAAAAQPASRPTAAPAATTAHQPPAEPSPLRGKTEKLTRTRALIAKRMLASLQTSAQLTTVVEVDVTKVARLREHAKADFLARNGVKLSFLPFFAQATVEALRIHPRLNASIDTEAGTVTYHDAEHLGMAVDTERGLMVPVIHNAGDLNLSGLAKRIADLAERTRTNKLSPDDVSGATFTLTNTGSRGALFDTPIFTPPQVGILGTGAVVKRAVVVEDPDLGELILPRSMAYLALSYDHRLVDGADAARFLATIKERLEAGTFETELGLA